MTVGRVGGGEGTVRAELVIAQATDIPAYGALMRLSRLVTELEADGRRETLDELAALAECVLARLGEALRKLGDGDLLDVLRSCGPLLERLRALAWLLYANGEIDGETLDRLHAGVSGATAHLREHERVVRLRLRRIADGHGRVQGRECPAVRPVSGRTRPDTRTLPASQIVGEQGVA